MSKDKLIYDLRESGMEFSAIGKQVGLSGDRCRCIYYRYKADLAHGGGILAVFAPYMSINAARRLLRARVFTVEAASALTYGDLCDLPGIGVKYADEIYGGLHPDDKH